MCVTFLICKLFRWKHSNRHETKTEWKRREGKTDRLKEKKTVNSNRVCLVLPADVSGGEPGGTLTAQRHNPLQPPTSTSQYLNPGDQRIHRIHNI